MRWERVKKRMEAVLILMLFLLTVSTTAAYIHNASKTGHPWVGSSLVLGASRTKAAANGQDTTKTQGAPSQGQSAQTLVRNSSANGVGKGSAAGNTDGGAAHQGGVTTSAAFSNLLHGWSSSDVQRFVSIAQKLIHSITPEDLNRIQKALDQGNENTAQAALTAVANEHLSESDEVWLSSHLAGSTPFGKVDVELLQQTLQQLKSELTPGERQLLQSFEKSS